MCLIIGLLYLLGVVGFVGSALLGMVVGVAKIVSNAPGLGFVLFMFGVLPLMLVGAFYGLFGTRLAMVWVIGMFLLGASLQMGPSFGCSAGM